MGPIEEILRDAEIDFEGSINAADLSFMVEFAKKNHRKPEFLLTVPTPNGVELWHFTRVPTEADIDHLVDRITGRL